MKIICITILVESNSHESSLSDQFNSIVFRFFALFHKTVLVVQVGALIAVLAEEGEDWKSITAPAEAAVEAGSSSEAAGEAAAAKTSQPTGGSTPGTKVNMPSLSPTMSEGTIVKWCKKVSLSRINSCLVF